MLLIITSVGFFALFSPKCLPIRNQLRPYIRPLLIVGAHLIHLGLCTKVWTTEANRLQLSTIYGITPKTLLMAKDIWVELRLSLCGSSQ